MIKIFLVEDEIFALRTLHRKIIDLNQDYEIVGTATDGLEALPKIQATKPAIVITDIRMSDMHGLTLIRKMKELNIPAIPVIISGYQEFEYAKQAMKLGVEDYLLKPVDLDELEKCLTNCRKRLEKKYLHKNIYSFLIGEETFSLEPVTSGDYFLLVYLIFSTPLNHSNTFFHPGTGFLSGTEVRTTFEKVLPPSPIFCFDGIFSNERIILIDMDSESEAKTENALSDIVPLLQKRFTYPVTLYYSNAHAKSLTYDIQKARRNCISNVVLGVSGVYHSLPPVAESENLTETIELLSLLLHQGDFSLVHANLYRMLRNWQESHKSFMSCEADLIFLLNSLKNSFTKSPNLDSSFLVENILCFSFSPEELADDFTQLLKEFTTPVKPIDTLSGEQLVLKIEDYFKSQLSHSITLQMLADEMNVSKAYLCRVFKKYKNITPMDYFNHLKIKRACELICNFSSLPLQELSDKLGFNDVYYFSKVFKKITGLSPTSYRKKMSPQS